MATPISSPEAGTLGAQAQHLCHDLRTPLGTLAAALDLLPRGRDRDVVLDAETRGVMERQVARLTALVNALQGLADEVTRRGM